MDATDLGRLVRFAADGDADAFTEIVRRYRDFVYGYCCHLTGSFEDARDLAQETFIRAYTRMNQLRDPESFGAWLRKIAANLCVRWAESRRETPVERIEPEKAPHESARAVAVREALSSLPENERLAVVLKYVNGYSYDDIAGFLEVSPAAVRGRLHRGRKMLKAEVLKMTKDTFDDNKLDEKFVLEAVDAACKEAVDRSKDNGEWARKKTDEAASLIDQLAPERVEDPGAVGRALLRVGFYERAVGEDARGEEHWDRAKTLFEQANDRDGVEEWRGSVAFDLLHTGKTAAAHELYSKIEEHWRKRRLNEPGVGHYRFHAAKRALESIGLDTDCDPAAFWAWDCVFERENGQIIHQGFTGLGFNNYPPERVCRMVFSPTPLPRVLTGAEPQVGDVLSDGPKEAVLESLSETVTTPAGTFTNCAYYSVRVFASDDRRGDVAATGKLWFAPGVGIVRIEHQRASEPVDVSDLTAYHVETPSSDYMPLAVGNWWKWLWVTGEEEFGLRSETYREIMAQDGNRWPSAGYVYAVRN